MRRFLSTYLEIDFCTAFTGKALIQKYVYTVVCWRKNVSRSRIGIAFSYARVLVAYKKKMKITEVKCIKSML